MKMKTVLSLVAAAVALLSHSAFAQEKSRAEVKEETKKAVKAGEESKYGEVAPGAKEMPMKSTKTRAERKGETKAAVKAGETPKAGEVPSKEAPAKSTKDRPAVKAEAKSAVKAGETKPGELAPDTKK